VRYIAAAKRKAVEQAGFKLGLPLTEEQQLARQRVEMATEWQREAVFTVTSPIGKIAFIPGTGRPDTTETVCTCARRMK
jgi:hypothetical protein